MSTSSYSSGQHTSGTAQAHSQGGPLGHVPHDQSFVPHHQTLGPISIIDPNNPHHQFLFMILVFNIDICAIWHKIAQNAPEFPPNRKILRKIAT